MNTPHDSLLGRNAAYPDRYDPGLLFPIARAAQRAAIGIEADAKGALPFHGVDVWNAYELSWLDARGKPEVALAEFRVPATTPNIVESKSFKLYLAGFNQERLASSAALRERLARDLSAATGGNVDVSLIAPANFASVGLAELHGESIDELPVAIESYGPPDANYLNADDGNVDESLVSQLLKTNCPVTGQPDWASVAISYAGKRIDREGLLRYLVSFRQHADFHEHCVERIYMDLMRRCAPRRLGVYARYTRRGGLDINPWRSSEPGDPPNTRVARQ
jgi:7-cyano-7-deazaguanine reductase